MCLVTMVVLLGAGGAHAARRVTQGDARAVLEAFAAGGWAVVLNGGTVVERAPADFDVDSMARIFPNAQWDGRRFCSLDWHVVSVTLIEGNPAGGSRTNTEIFEALSQRTPLITLDGALLDTERTAAKRFTNPEFRGFVEAFYVSIGALMAPEDLWVGQHSTQFTGIRPGQPPIVMPPVTFFIDAPGEGACL
jgi:hypothetical protein